MDSFVVDVRAGIQ